MRKVSIMIIDDDEMDRYLLKRILKKINITSEIFESTNGKFALDFLKNYDENSRQYGDDFPPLLIFLDINMPLMNGFEFLEEFSKLQQEGDRYTSSVFTMFTSSERDEDKKKAEAYDFVKGYIVKGSVTPEGLQETIENCLLAS